MLGKCKKTTRKLVQKVTTRQNGVSKSYTVPVDTGGFRHNLSYKSLVCTTTILVPYPLPDLSGGYLWT